MCNHDREQRPGMLRACSITQPPARPSSPASPNPCSHCEQSLLTHCEQPLLLHCEQPLLTLRATLAHTASSASRSQHRSRGRELEGARPSLHAGQPLPKGRCDHPPTSPSLPGNIRPCPLPAAGVKAGRGAGHHCKVLRGQRDCGALVSGRRPAGGRGLKLRRKVLSPRLRAPCGLLACPAKGQRGWGSVAVVGGVGGFGGLGDAHLCGCWPIAELLALEPCDLPALLALHRIKG